MKSTYLTASQGTFGALGLSEVTGNGASNPLRVNEQTTISALEEMIDSYEFMVHAGDMAYADYWLKEEIQGYLPTTTTAQGAQVYESILNAFYDELINITSAKAYMVNAGNHEANCDNGGTTNKTSGVAYTESICLPGQTNFTGYINHWRMPSGPSGGLGNFWYSYDYGMVHFVHIDTETDLGNGLIGPDEGSPEYAGPFGSDNQQIDWLADDLASVNRTVTPWIVVFGHRGWYLSASSSVCPNCRTAFEGLLHEYDVDLYINGHAHLYERTAPIYNNVIDPNGLSNPSSTLYITNGAAGHYDGLDPFTAIQPYSVYRQDSDYSWTTISFTNATHMTVSSLWSANNTIFDSATLYKAHVYSTNSSSSTTSSTSSTSTTPSTTTNPTTPTTTVVYPTYTNFNGQGHLYVYTGGLNEGDVGSADTWYNTPGQNTATYTAVPLYSNGTAFTLQHSDDYCAIGTDSSFGCGVESSDATIFGQTLDGNLTYNGSPAFYASSSASSGAKSSIYATPLPVSINIVWGVNGPPLPASTTSTPVSSATSSSSTTSNTTTSAASATSSPTSSSVATGSCGTVVATGSQVVATTTFVTVTSTETDSATITLTSTVTDSTTITETDSVAMYVIPHPQG